MDRLVGLKRNRTIDAFSAISFAFFHSTQTTDEGERGLIKACYLGSRGRYTLDDIKFLKFAMIQGK